MTKIGWHLRSWGTIIILEDINAWFGLQHEVMDGVLCNFGDSKTNGNRDRLVSLCLEKGMFITNAWFSHKIIHFYTWWRGDSHSTIDFVVAYKTARTSKRYKSYESF